MYNGSVEIISVIIMIVIIIVISVEVAKREKKKNAKKASIRENCTPRRGIIKDILIESKRGTDAQDRNLKFYPIIEDKLTGKNYISFGKYDYTSYSTLVMSCFNTWDYDITVSGNKLNIGDEVNIYINQEIEIIKKVNGMINLNGIPRKYKGRKGEKKDLYIEFMDEDEIANIAMDSLTYDETEILLYEGFIDTNLYE